MESITCRIGCGACCIAPSISSPIPDMPQGKPAGVRCVQLDINNSCLIFQKANRPKVCSSLQATKEMCGDSCEHAMRYLTELELLTKTVFVGRKNII